MNYIIVLSQLSLVSLFLFTLKCELSKLCSDSVIFVSIRTFIMCTAAIAFFMLFEDKYHNLTLLAVIFIPFLSGILYAALETLSSGTLKYQKGT